ncbi:hypothetical protein CRUP_008934, partial [Coryphaenoides rupestris]
PTPGAFGHRTDARACSGPFTPVAGSKTLLIKAFHEHRAANTSVRLLAIVLRQEGGAAEPLRDGGLVASAEAERTAHLTHYYYFLYGTGDFLCQHVPEPSCLPLNFTLCLPAMFNHVGNVLQFVLMGIQRAVVYNTSCSVTMETVMPWPIDAFLKPSASWLPSMSPGEIHYYGQIPAHNDCVYRYVPLRPHARPRRGVIVARFHDNDVWIYRTGDISLETQVSVLQDTHEEMVNFYFPNNVFPHKEEEENSSYDLPEWSHLPSANFVLHVLREVDRLSFNMGKLILDPRSVLQMEVHSVQKHVPGGPDTVGPELGRLHHVRRREDSKQKRKDRVRDEGQLRVAAVLVL